MEVKKKGNKVIIYLWIADEGDADGQFALLSTAEFAGQAIAFRFEIDVGQRLFHFVFNLLYRHALYYQ